MLSFAWRGPGGGGTSWDFPLGERGDGTKPIEALKNMQLGDMPDFDDAMAAALGEPGKYGLLDSDARMKHAIIISDGDPQPPTRTVLQKYIDNKITVSTIMVYPHGLGNRTTMKDIAKKTGGRSYGPIESNPSQLPQIFTKEASVVRRSLISEDKAGIEVKATDSPSDLVTGIDLNSMPKIYGLVLTAVKPKPEVEMPLVAGEKNDPLFAHWQTGLGKSAVFTSDAWNKWAANWVGSDAFGKFWSQVVRGVSRPAESGDFDVSVTTEGTKGKIVVEAIGQDQAFKNFLTLRGSVVGPDLEPVDITLSQTKPGIYEAEFDAKDPGNYVVGLVSAGGSKPSLVRSGTVVNSSPELRQLKSDRVQIQEILDRTGGRMLNAFDPNVSLFTRVGLHPSTSPRPIWDILLPILLALILLDIAIRRIAWDWNATRRSVLSALGFVQSYTQTRKVETTQSIDALRDIRSKKAESKPTIDLRRPDSSKKFEGGEGIEGDISKVVGGATSDSGPSKKSTREPPPSDSGKSEGGMGSLMDAKRKAQEEIKRREEGKK